jgi:hypothetical protein
MESEDDKSKKMELNTFSIRQSLERPWIISSNGSRTTLEEAGVDGFRVDTVETEKSVWEVFNQQSKLAFEEWKPSRTDAAWWWIFILECMVVQLVVVVGCLMVL